MLRTLGWNKSNIVLVTLIKCTIFFILPGFVAAMIFLWLFTFIVKFGVEDMLKRSIILDFGFLPMLVGILVAYALPLISMIKPVINGLAV
jgi:ABC-type antimicrobial peptide transport system permease subunit